MLITHELMNNKSYLVKRYVEICIFKQKKLKKFLNKKFSVPFTHGIAHHRIFFSNCKVWVLNFEKVVVLKILIQISLIDNPS